MIYTVTLNPSLDYTMHPTSVVFGETNRSERESICVGGKGINVSIVLKNLHTESVALGFTAGFVGRAIADELEALGVRSDFIELCEGNSRINVKLKGEHETEINGNGPEISEADVERLCQRLDTLEDGDILVLAGSIPKSLPRDTYEKILARLSGKDIRFVVDACGEILLNTLKYKPFLIKPNRAELSEICGRKLDSDDGIVAAAKELREKGARNVLVSLGGDGSLLLDENGTVHRRYGISGKVINTVGSGDSMVAGFICGCLNGSDYSHALNLATACGTATAFSELLADEKQIYELLEKIS